MIRPAVLDPIEVPYLKKDSREKLFLAPFCLNENFTIIRGKAKTLKIWRCIKLPTEYKILGLTMPVTDHIYGQLIITILTHLSIYSPRT